VSVEAKASVATAAEATRPEQRARYYRPELDVLRFAAFFSVFIFHAPHIPRLEFVQRAGSAGLPLFFFLSAFLITELLLRERELLGTVRLKAFYVRRILRIWPLYFLGVGTALLWSRFVPIYHLEQLQILYLLFFVGFLGRELHYNPAGVLWSVSVEEMFYLVWPMAGKLGKFRWAIAAFFVCAAITLLATSDVWYNPLSQFMFFAFGGATALFTHGKRLVFSDAVRLLLLALAAVMLVYDTRLQWGLLRFLVCGVACAVAILGLLDVRPSVIPGALVYLGKISYGLYVFHLSCLVLVMRAVDHWLPLGVSRRALLIQCVALTLCIGISALSYHYFELPFLKLKKRFEFVKSRPT
jgi:peptidoglycan/LPS O-acetylase OafA/YrhL